MQDYLMECRRLRRENEALRMRIAELESAQQWHPASDPPKHENGIEGQTASGMVFTVWYVPTCLAYGRYVSNGEEIKIVRWRALPPLPESRHDQ